MTSEQLLEACKKLSVFAVYTTKDNRHDLTRAVLGLQFCLEEMGKYNRKEVDKLLEEI